MHLLWPTEKFLHVRRACILVLKFIRCVHLAESGPVSESGGMSLLRLLVAGSDGGIRTKKSCRVDLVRLLDGSPGGSSGHGSIVLERESGQARGRARSTGVMRAMAEGPRPLHPVLQPLSFLLGTWRGEGEGGFPTIQSFKYGEEIKLWHSGKPVIAYSQKTWKSASGEPMHAESGYWRPKPDGSIEVVIAQSTGLAEVQKGSFDAEKKTVQLQSSVVGNASKVLEIGRVFQVEGEELRYTVEMAIHGHDQQPHLRAVLRKVTGG